MRARWPCSSRLRGTPFVYQGEELGLPDAEIPPERVVDVDGRDPERAPIPWRPPSAAGPGAGFTSGEPWLPLVAGAEDLCVERQAADPRSTLTLYRRAAALRAATPALQTGAQRMLDAGENVLAWLREEAGERLVVALNFAAAEASLALSSDGTLPLSTDPARAVGRLQPAGALRLGPEEAVVLRLAAVSAAPSSTVVESLRRPGRRGPVGGVDDVDHVPGVLGGRDARRPVADPVDELHDVLEDVLLGSARWASVTCGSSQPARSPGSRRGSAAGTVTRSRPG